MAQITMNRRSFLAAAAATALVPTAAAFAEEAPAGGDYDIVVVGMGGAGMCAALAASEAGVEKIVILEKNAMEGGNTIFASSGMNASETAYQKDQGIEDSTDLFIQETIAGGHNWNNVELVTQMCEGSAAAIDWLAEHGLVLDNITTTGGMSVPRCHRPTDGSAVGAALAAFQGIDCYVPHGGFIVALATNNVALFCLDIVIGALVGAAILVAMKPKLEQK